MRGKIIRVLDPKMGALGNIYYRVEFILEDGSFAKTDIVPVFKNYKRWKGLLDLFEKGFEVYVDNLSVSFTKNKKIQEVNADSRVVFTDQKFDVSHGVKKKVIQERMI